ncbi:MAG: MlaD family protein [Myxococcota bacterium]
MSVPFRLRRAEWVAGALIVIVGTAALLALLLVSRGGGAFDAPVHYVVMLADGHGVTEGSRVQMLGIDVGRVSQVRITDDNQVKVQLEIRPAFAEKVRADSKATLEASFGLQGVLAGIGVTVSPGSPQMPVLAEGDVIDAVEPEHIADMLPGVSSDPLVQDLEVLVRNLRLLTDEATDPDGSLRKVMRSMQAVSARIEAGEGTAGKMLADDAALYQQVADAVADLDATVKRFDGVLRRSDGVMKKSGSTLDSASGVFESADALVASADDMVQSADGVLKKTGPVLDHTDEALGKLETAVGTFSDATEELSEITKRLDVLIEEMLVVTKAAGRVYPIRRHVKKARRDAE